jgi:hypothetical protein
MVWYVFYEVRQRGAIGLFAGRVLAVDADSRESALAKAQEALNDEGWETRFPIDVFQPLRGSETKEKTQ